MRLLRATKKRPHWRVEYTVGDEPVGVLLSAKMSKAKALDTSESVVYLFHSTIPLLPIEFVSIALVPKREPRPTTLPDHVLDEAAREQMREACGERGASRFGISGGETGRYRVTEAWLANEAVRRGCLDPGAWVEGMPWAEVEGCEALEQLSLSQLGALFDIVDAWRGMTAEELEAEELAHAEWTREQRPDTELASRRTQPKGDDQ